MVGLAGSCIGVGGPALGIAVVAVFVPSTVAGVLPCIASLTVESTVGLMGSSHTHLVDSLRTVLADNFLQCTVAEK